jgi:uncharacterized protein (TIGR03437 family)
VVAEVLCAGEAPGLVGLVGCLQVNARIPANFPVEAAVGLGSAVPAVGGAESRVGVTFWVK